MKTLFKLLRFANDLKAVKKGKVPQRVARRYAYRSSGRVIRKLFK